MKKSKRFKCLLVTLAMVLSLNPINAKASGADDSFNPDGLQAGESISEHYCCGEQRGNTHREWY